MNCEKYVKNHFSSLAGKSIVLFGATGGIGKHLARYILMLCGSLITVDRNPQKAAALKAELQLEFANSSIINLYADLSDFKSVVSVCEQLKKLKPYAIIHNAGAYSIPRKMCDTGFLNVFQINFLSPYYITRELLPIISSQGGRIIGVGSIAHNYSKTSKTDIDFSARKASSLVYGNAKRYLMFSLFSLIKAYPNTHFAITHPGITFTNITAHYPKLIFAIIKHPMKILFMSAKKAAISILAGLFCETKEFEWIGPKFFNIWGLPTKKLLKTCQKSEYAYICETAEKVYKKIKNV